MDAWQRASDDERTAFVARYPNDIRRLLTALDEQQPARSKDQLLARATVIRLVVCGTRIGGLCSPPPVRPLPYVATRSP